MESIKPAFWLYLLIIVFWAAQSAPAQSQAPSLEWRDDYGDTTSRASLPLLAKTAWPARVTIDGDSCHLYRTGIFFKTVKLMPGLNRFTATVQSADGQEASNTREIYRSAPQPPRPSWPLWIDSTSVQPGQSQVLQSGDHLRISFIGAKGHSGSIEFKPSKVRVPLRRSDFSDYSRYEADFPLARLPVGKPQAMRMVLKGASAQRKKSSLHLEAKAAVLVQAAEQLPLLQVTRDGALLIQSLGTVRLGAPVIAELPQGTVLQSSGQSGDFWRVRLDDRDEGYIAGEDVEIAPPPALLPAYYITTLSAAPGAGADIVTIPWPQPVPYAIMPDPANRLLRIRLYGVKSSSTWITHRENLKVVDWLSWEQISPETYQINVLLQSARIWGYTLKPAGAVLELRLKYPPAGVDSLTGATGIKVAIEAGHGGSNLGAVGLSGMEEKSVNLDVALRLEKLCMTAGMQVLQVRESDVDMSLAAKKEKVEESDADLLVCIHANSGGTANGYLGVSGASTYYHNPYWADFAKIMYGRLLQLPLQEFGCVGSFNYRIARTSSRPAILVEMAFMSNAEDEEKLFLPEFRQKLAEKILSGIQDFAATMRE
jgi:N-acetylmuramoyl-L-alanine amidase